MQVGAPSDATARRSTTKRKKTCNLISLTRNKIFNKKLKMSKNAKKFNLANTKILLNQSIKVFKPRFP
jgi:hypothetical protein